MTQLEKVLWSATAWWKSWINFYSVKEQLDQDLSTWKEKLAEVWQLCSIINDRKIINRESIQHLLKYKTLGTSNETKNLLYAKCGSAEEFCNRIWQIVKLFRLKKWMDKFIKEKYSSVSYINRHYHCLREYLNCDSLQALRLYWKSIIYNYLVPDICYRLWSETEISQLFCYKHCLCENYKLHLLQIR